MWCFFLTHLENFFSVIKGTICFSHKRNLPMVFLLIFVYKTCISTVDLLIVSKLIRKKLKVHKLKVISNMFFLFYFLSLKKGTFKTRKNNVYFTSKILVVLEVFYFQIFRTLNFLTYWNASTWKNKYILLNNFKIRHSLIVKIGQFM